MRQIGGSTEDDLADLQRRFHLLEGDKKAYYEASLWTVKQNKETLELVKKENKELREALMLLQKERGSVVTERNSASIVEKLNEEVNELKKKYNEIRHVVAAKQKENQQRHDELKDLEKDAARTIEGSDHPMIRNIRALENKLEKALMKVNEAQSFQKTYLHIKKRLMDERRTFDVQLGTVMNTLKGKEGDLGELIQMSGDALRAKETAKQELQKLEATIEEERKVREKELAERRKMVQAKIELNQRMEKRERKRRELQLEAAGELNLDGEQNLIKNYVSQGFYSASAEHELQLQKEKVTTYKEAFRRIKEATGIEDVNEVISKFLTQDETAANLTQMTKEAQARIEALNEEKAEAKGRVEELRFAGPSAMGSRRIVDEYDAKLTEALQKCDRNKKRYERVSKLLVNAQAGIEHLQERLECVQIDGVGALGGGGSSSVGSVAGEVDTPVVALLLESENKLMRLWQAVKSDTEDIAQLAAKQMLNSENYEISAANTRVNMSDEEDEESETEANPDEQPDQDEEPIMDRTRLKDFAQAVVDKAQRKAKARRTQPKSEVQPKAPQSARGSSSFQRPHASKKGSQTAR